MMLTNKKAFKGANKLILSYLFDLNRVSFKSLQSYIPGCGYVINMFEQLRVYRTPVIFTFSCLIINIIHTSLNKYLANILINPFVRTP